MFKHPNVSHLPLHYHYHTDPLEFRKILVQKLAHCLCNWYALAYQPSLWLVKFRGSAKVSPCWRLNGDKSVPLP